MDTTYKRIATALTLICIIILGYQNCSNNSLKGGYVAPASTNTSASQGPSNTFNNEPPAGGALATIYRSVGPSNTSILACGTSIAGCAGLGTMTITGTNATFGSSTYAKIGVGDALIYDCSGDQLLGAGDCIAFISGRTDAQHFIVLNLAGGIPGQYNGSVWQIYRAYTSLANAADVTRGGTENAAIAAIDRTLGNFDTWTGGKNLVTANQQWNIALYADGIDSTPVSFNAPVTGLGGWTTSAINNLRVYTPYLMTDVGVSQRHAGGTMGLAGYQMTITAAQTDAIDIQDVPNLTLEGLQIFENIPTVSANPGGTSAIYVEYDDTISALTIRDNLIQGSDPTTTQQNFYGIHIPLETTGSKFYIYNNIIYNFKSSLNKGLSISSSGTTTYSTYVYNNTTYGSNYGINNSGNAVMVIKNNIANGCTDDFTGTFDPTSIDNISDDATSPEATGRALKVTFNNAATNDFRPAPNDTIAKGKGANLSADSYLPFTTDIANLLRPAAWSVGASEY